MKLVESTREYFKSMYPWIKDVSVVIKRTKDGILSKIHIKMPGKVLHAQKVDATPSKSLDRSRDAIHKQIIKMKAKRLQHRGSMGMDIWY